MEREETQEGKIKRIRARQGERGSNSSAVLSWVCDALGKDKPIHVYMWVFCLCHCLYLQMCGAYAAACMCVCTHLHILFWQGQSWANPHLALWLSLPALGADPERRQSQFSCFTPLRPPRSLSARATRPLCYIVTHYNRVNGLLLSVMNSIL